MDDRIQRPGTCNLPPKHKIAYDIGAVLNIINPTDQCNSSEDMDAGMLSSWIRCMLLSNNRYNNVQNCSECSTCRSRGSNVRSKCSKFRSWMALAICSCFASTLSIKLWSILQNSELAVSSKRNYTHGKTSRSLVKHTAKGEVKQRRERRNEEEPEIIGRLVGKIGGLSLANWRLGFVAWLQINRSTLINSTNHQLHFMGLQINYELDEIGVSNPYYTKMVI